MADVVGYSRQQDEQVSSATNEDDSIEMSEIKHRPSGKGGYDRMREDAFNSTGLSSARGGRAATSDDLDQTNKYMDEDDEEGEDEEEEDSSDGETEVGDQTKDDIDEIQQQYDRQLGELYKKQREEALKR